jgi:hypothetical protein
MDGARLGLGVAGGLLIGFGLFRLATNLDRSDLIAFLLWLAAALVVHDVFIAPLTLGTGVLLTRVPARPRRFVQGALVVGALVTVIAIPLIGRQGTQPEAKALLLRDYAGNLAVMLGLTAAVGLVLYVTRLLRQHHSERA